MTEHIVERLRNSWPNSRDALEAADEIERLREENKQLRSMLAERANEAWGRELGWRHSDG